MCFSNSYLLALIGNHSYEPGFIDFDLRFYVVYMVGNGSVGWVVGLDIERWGNSFCFILFAIEKNVRKFLWNGSKVSLCFMKGISNKFFQHF